MVHVIIPFAGNFPSCYYTETYRSLEDLKEFHIVNLSLSFLICKMGLLQKAQPDD